MGRILSTTGIALGSEVEIAAIFRYRGYIYDSETQLYYLQTRYYDHNTGRFISPDGVISSIGGEILGNNRYIYGFNDPVNFCDPNGNWPKLSTLMFATAGLLLIGAVALTIVSGGSGAPVATIMAKEAIDFLIIGAALYTAAGITSLAIENAPQITAPWEGAKEKEKARELPIPIPSPRTKEDDDWNYYYPVTTAENAALIAASGKIKAGRLEGGKVFAWRHSPSLEAAQNAGIGSKAEVVVYFRTKTTFTKDENATNKYTAKYGPLESLTSYGYINVQVIAIYPIK